MLANAPGQFGVLRAQAPDRQRPRQHRKNRAQLEWLENIIHGARFHGLDRGIDRPLAGHHDSHHVRVRFQSRFQQRDAVHIGHHQIRQYQIEFPPLPNRRECLSRRAEARGCLMMILQGVTKRPHLRGFVIHDDDTRRNVIPRRHFPFAHSIHNPLFCCTHCANASLNSFNYGGLLSTRSTCCGMSPSVFNRWPQPVSIITGVDAAACLMAVATRRPSTFGMPKSVITTSKTWPFSFACWKVSMPARPPFAGVTICPSVSKASRNDLISSGSSSMMRMRRREGMVNPPLSGRDSVAGVCGIGKLMRNVVPFPTALSISISAL